MKPEQAMWRAIRPLLKGLDPIRVENLVGPGTPDVNCTRGWIELKYIAKWPKDPEAIVKVDHFTPQQRAWHVRRQMSGGKSWVLLKVGENSWLLMRGDNAAVYLGKATKIQLILNSWKCWPQKPTSEELIACLY